MSSPTSVARKPPGGPPEAKEKLRVYMCEYMPETKQKKKCLQTPPEPRKGVYKDALVCLEETSCFNLFLIVCIIVQV